MKFKLLFIACLTILSFKASFAQIGIANSTPVTQNFDGIGTAATASLPTNWKMSPAGDAAPTWTNAANFTATNQAANSGSPTQGARYNWGNGTTTTDRAIGFMTSGSYANPNSVMAYYQNTGTTQISDLTIAFDIERYRINSSAASVNFFTSSDGITWTPQAAGNTGAFTTGTSAYDFTGGAIVSRSVTLTGINLAAGGNFYLRWNFDTANGNSQGLGLDNVSVTATFAAPPFTTIQDGNWNTATTWTGGVVPSSTDNVIINHTVGVTAATTRAAGTTTTVSTVGVPASLNIQNTSFVNNGTVTVNTTMSVSNSTFTNNGIANIPGTFTILAGGWANGSNFTYPASGHLNFNSTSNYIVNNTDVFWPATNSPATVSVRNGGVTMNAGMVRTVASSLRLYAGLDAPTAAIIANGNLRIEPSGYITNSPIYGATSTLIYTTGAAYGRGREWFAVGVGTIGTTPGYPNNVTVTANTILNYNNGTPQAKAMAGNLTIDAGSAFNMNDGGGASNGALTVAGNTLVSGSLTLGNAVGDDFRVGANLTVTGTFNGNGRAVIFFAPSGTQIVTGPSGMVLPYVGFDAAGSRTVQFNNNYTISAPNAGNAIFFGSAADILNLNSFTLTIGTSGIANAILGAGTFRGTTTSNLTLLGTGTIGVLSFTTGFQNLGTLTINRTSATLAATLGTPLMITTSLALTNGRLDVGNNPLTIGSAATISGAGANNYVIADVANGTSAAVRKVLAFGPVVNFDFPIGDSAASANGSQYSPTRIVNLSGATYSAGAYVSAAVNDIKHPSFDATTDYITRYWDIQTSGVTSPSAFTMSATYQDSDIVGTETSFLTNRWNGTTWANAGIAVGASSNLLTDTSGFVAGGINHFTAGRRDQEINVIQTATTTTYLHNSTYNFGSILVGNNLDVQFTVQNTGQIDLALPGTNTIVGGPSYAFAPAGTLATGPLAGPAGTRNFTIRFAPAGAGTFTGSITIPNNDPTGAEAPYVINFTGIGIVPSPEIRVERSDNGDIPNGVAANTGYLTIFAAQDIGTSSAARTFFIRNQGTATLNVTSITSSLPDFTIAATTPATIAPAGFVGFTITFTPTAVGTRTATISIVNNDSDENPFTFGVQGTGQCATTTTFNVSPTSGSANTLVTINSPTFNLTGITTASFNGTTATITPISATQATVIVPVGAVSGAIILTNGNGCQATTPFTVYNTMTGGCQGGNATGELFISEVTDATTGGVSYVEIYNGTASPVNMSGYSIQVYSNGVTAAPTSTTLLNNYVLNPGAVYLFALGISSSPSNLDTCTIVGGNGEMANQASGVAGVNFNNNEHDYIALYKNSSASRVDSWGVFGSQTWANGLGLGDRGAVFRRKNNVTVPKVAYTNADWDITDWAGTGQSSCSTNDYSDIGTFNFTRTNPPTITTHPTFTPTCKATSFTVVATEGFAGGNQLAYQWYFTFPGNTTWAVVPNNATVSGGTTATLTITNIAGLEGYQFYCEVRENGATCYTASNAVRILGTGAVTWDGTTWTPSTPTASTPAVINGIYNTTANGSFEACSLTVSGSGALTIAANTYVSIVNDLTVDLNGSLSVMSNGSLVMIEDGGSVTNYGTMQVSRTTQPFVKYDYTYWSSPIAAATIGTTFPGWRMDYSWIFQTANYSDVTGPNGTGPADGFDDNLDTWIHTTPATSMMPAKGYVIMGPTNLSSYPASSTVTFSGKVNNGVVTIPLAMSANAAATDDDFNIIGNPYPSSVFADDFINTNTNTSGTVKFWTHQAPVSNTAPGPYQSNFVTSDYAMYNLSGGTASGTGSTIPSGMIATGQGFLVEALTGTDVVFNNAMRDKSQINTNFYRQAQNPALAVQKDRVWINFKHNIGLFSQQLVAYIDGATLDYDRGFDGKASKSGNAVSFYSFIGEEKYRIQGRPSFSESDIVPMGYSTTLPGSYTITIDHAEGQLSDASQPIYIEDKLLNIIHDLKESDYVFTTELGTFNDRFQLRYTTEALSTPGVGAQNQVGIISSNQVIQVKSMSEIKSIEVFDMLGRRIFNKDAVNALEFDTRLDVAKQPLLVKVILNNGTAVTKKIIH